MKQQLESQYDVVTAQLISEFTEDGQESDVATKANLRTVLRVLSGADVNSIEQQKIPGGEHPRKATPDDLVVLYIASHGYADPTGRFYVIPSDVGAPAGISDQLLDRCLKSSEQSQSCELAREFLRHSISSDELADWLRNIDAGEMVMVLDSCHAGAVSGADFKPGPMGDRGFGQLSYDKGMLVLAATQAQGLALGVLDIGGLSLLSHALIRHEPAYQHSFDLKQWLGMARKRVPQLYRQFVQANELMPQEPALFDFSRD